MPVITIRGQEASGAPEIGTMVAQELQIDYVDSKIITDVAERLNRHEIEVLKKETPPRTIFGRVARALSMSGGALPGGYNSGDGETFYMPMEMYPWEIPIDDKLYLRTLKIVITELAKSQAIVIRGRGSQFILKDFPGAFHVLVVAPLDLRVKRVMERMKLDEEKAKNEIKRSDSNHHEFIRRYFHAETENPLDYDLVINTERTTIEEAAFLVVNAVHPRKNSEPGNNML
ncbi:MAG: AAA family ATPase [Dehalococcoidales bacterium]